MQKAIPEKIQNRLFDKDFYIGTFSQQPLFKTLVISATLKFIMLAIIILMKRYFKRILFTVR